MGKGKSISISKSEVIILLARAEISNGHNGVTPEKLAHLIEGRVREVLPQTSVFIGVGNVASQLNEFQASYNQAHTVLEIMRTFKRNECVMSFRDLGIYKLLFHIQGVEHLGEFYEQQLGRLIDYDNKHGTSLLQTLDAYLSNNCNLRQTSRAIYLHLNTLNYRLRKVREICGFDLDDPDVRLNLHVAMKIKHLMNHLLRKPSWSVRGTPR